MLSQRAHRLTHARREYLALVGSFILIGLEIIVRIITLALRKLACIREIEGTP